MRPAAHRLARAVVALAVLPAGVAVPAAAGATPDEPPLLAPAEPTTVTAERALALARSGGSAVQATAATTPTDTLTANPDGTLTLTRTLAPVRKRVDGGWADLDATLRRNPDGTISPNVTTASLTLSGGGVGPLASMALGGRRVSFTPPLSLPPPTLAGDAAVYPQIFPGVDLRVRATAQGGFSEVLIVHTAAAAANPAVATFVLSVSTTDVTLAADPAGNLAGKDRSGHTVLSAPAAWMWDSATGGQPLAGQHQPAQSGPDGPGAYAHTAPIAVAVTGQQLTLAANKTLLDRPDLTYPLYLDPTFTWTPIGGTPTGWATVSKGTSAQNDYSATNYWKHSPDPDHNLQVGNSGYGSGGIWSHSLINFAVPVSTLTGATINTATITMTELHSYSCTPSTVTMYAPATTLTSQNATWDDWAGVNVGAVVASATVAHGYNSSCPPAGVPFNVKNTIVADVAANKTVQTFLLTAVNEATDLNGYKEFDETSPRLSITYNHPPNKPAGLTTSPATSCAASPPTIVGDGPVSLYAPVSDRNGGTLGVTYQLWKTSIPGTILASSDPNQLTATSGTIALLTVPRATLSTAAGGAITQFSWKVQVTDFGATSPWSDVCSFRFDPTRTGPPTVTPPTTAIIGQPVTVAVAPPATGTTPSGYLYQLNGGVPGQVTAASGTASITVTPTRFTNTLTLTGLSPGGNIGDTAAVVFNATPAAVAADADLTGDAAADLLTVGGTNNLPAGLWLAAGKNTGQVVAGAVNIGANGNGTTTVGSPADFTGGQVITGHFTGTGLQDVLVYYPAGALAGGGSLLNGNGDGSVLQAQLDGNQTTIPVHSLADVDDELNPVADPLQIANAADTAGNGDPYPDLLAISGTTGNHHLSYLFSAGTAQFDFPTVLPNPTPTGGTDWNNWRIATSQLPSGTAIFLWNRTTGGLYLWTNLALDPGSGALTYTQRTIRSSGWNTGATLTLHAADINGDTTPDLWTVAAGAIAKAHLVTGLDTTPAITAQPQQTLLTAAHAWPLNDAATGTVGTVTDATGTLNAAGAGGAVWNQGDLFDPDVLLNGTGAVVATATAALNTTADFTVSAWVKPTAVGGTVVSQDGTTTAGFKLWAEPADGSWRFAMPASDTATPTWHTASAAPGSARLGVWTQLVASYKQSTGVMNLYLNAVHVATATHTGAWSATGGLRIGDHRTGATTRGGRLAGQVSTVQVWNQIVDPTQAHTPAGYYQPMPATRFLDTRTGTGGATGPLAPGATVQLTIAGVNTIPAGNVTAVAIVIAAVAPTGSGHLVVYPGNTPRPTTSNLNYTTGVTVSNLVIVPVGPNGAINIYVGGGGLHLLGDVNGYFTADAAQANNTSYTQLTATRILDTRTGLGAPTGKVGAGATLRLQISGVAGIPAGVKAVAINLSTTGQTATSYLLPYADGTTQPAASGLQYQAGIDISQLAVVPVGSNGKIAIYNNNGQTHIIGDVIGYFTTGTTGRKYHAIAATRIIDTRQDGGPLPGGGIKKVAQGNTVIAANPTLITNATIVSPTNSGFLDAYTDGATRPAISLINFRPGVIIPNLTLVGTGNGTTVYHAYTTGSLHLVIDCLGYFADN